VDAVAQGNGSKTCGPLGHSDVDGIVEVVVHAGSTSASTASMT
jgi:hypothetical protein